MAHDVSVAVQVEHPEKLPGECLLVGDEKRAIAGPGALADLVDDRAYLIYCVFLIELGEFLAMADTLVSLRASAYLQPGPSTRKGSSSAFMKDCMRARLCSSGPRDDAASQRR